ARVLAMPAAIRASLGAPCWRGRKLASCIRASRRVGRVAGDVGAIRELTTPLVRAPLRVSGRPAAAGRLSIEGAKERPIDRTATPRVGTARCRLDS
ncbi:MAG TPA: hypothetical protein VFP09_06775, partial [Desertimonas sp.]|nr:hypothetical protein [Desertimonas sp.]